MRSKTDTSFPLRVRPTLIVLWLALGLLLVLPTCAALSNSTSFSDVPTEHPYHDAIYDLASRGIINGYDDHTYGPDNPVRRQQFAKMMVKTKGFPVSEADICTFADVPKSLPGSYVDASDVFYPDHYVAVLVARGITQGKTATTFDPFGHVTRQQLITFVVRAAALPDPSGLIVAPFTPAQFYPSEHYENACLAYHYGLLEGLEALGPSYDFMAHASRGECAQLLSNLLSFEPSALWADLAAGAQTSLGIKTDGSLWAWGQNSFGQLGDGTTSYRSVPTRVGTDSDWKTAAVGNYAVAVKSDGSLWAWGHNSVGQLGDGTTTDRCIPTRIGTDTDWKAVAVYNQSLAIRANGSLWAWGFNNCGQLGDGTTTDRCIPTRIGTDTDWKAVAAAHQFSLAAKTDGSLWAWGLNNCGQLGDGTTTGRKIPTRIGTDTDWKAVEAGNYHSVALKADSSLWAWGSNEHGQLGDGTTTDRYIPTRIGTDTDWKAVEAGGSHSLAIKTDGSLWAWGSNEHGQLGDGTHQEHHIPTPLQED